MNKIIKIPTDKWSIKASKKPDLILLLIPHQIKTLTNEKVKNHRRKLIKQKERTPKRQMLTLITKFLKLIKS